MDEIKPIPYSDDIVWGPVYERLFEFNLEIETLFFLDTRHVNLKSKPGARTLLDKPIKQGFFKDII